MKKDEEQEQYKRIIENEFNQIRESSKKPYIKIDSEFIERYRSLLVKDLLEICPNVEIFPEMALSDIFD